MAACLCELSNGYGLFNRKMSSVGCADSRFNKSSKRLSFCVNGACALEEKCDIKESGGCFYNRIISPYAI